MLLGVSSPGWGGVCTRPCSPPPDPLQPSPMPQALSRQLCPHCPGDPEADAALGMLGRQRAGLVAAPSTWLSRPPQANRAAPGGARQGEETARGGAARSRAGTQLSPPYFPSRGCSPWIGSWGDAGSGAEPSSWKEERVGAHRMACSGTSSPVGAGSPDLEQVSAPHLWLPLPPQPPTSAAMVG